MPTSSQALFLMNKEGGIPGWDKSDLCLKKSTSCSQRSLKPCPVSHVDINELWKSSIGDLGEHLIVDDLSDLEEKDCGKVQSEFTIRGYHTVLSYNKAAGTFSWKFNKEDQASENTESTGSEETEEKMPKERPKTGKATGRKDDCNTDLQQQRPQTAGGIPTRKTSVTFAKPLYYSCSNKGDKLVCFGLRMPVTKDNSQTKICGKSILKTQKSSEGATWSNPKSDGQSSNAPGGDSGSSGFVKAFRRNNVDSKPLCSNIPASDIKLYLAKKGRENQSQKQKKLKEEKIESVNFISSYSSRVLPSVYMRKGAPDAGPYDVCFSLRDNERFSHKDLRDTILKQTGVEVKQLRYEALAIRVGDNGIRNRWIAGTGSQEEADKLIELGIHVDNDCIVVMSLNEVLEREYRTYQYLSQTTAEHRAAHIGGKLCKNNKT